MALGRLARAMEQEMSILSKIFDKIFRRIVDEMVKASSEIPPKAEGQ